MNPYKILNVSKTSTLDEIKKAYRILAMKYHPDRNIGNKEAEENFKKVQEAYDMLSNTKPEKKKVRPTRGTGFTFGDAPEPKVDLWGEPIQPEHKWVDVFADNYYDDTQLDVRRI